MIRPRRPQMGGGAEGLGAGRTSPPLRWERARSGPSLRWLVAVAAIVVAVGVLLLLLRPASLAAAAASMGAGPKTTAATTAAAATNIRTHNRDRAEEEDEEEFVLGLEEGAEGAEGLLPPPAGGRSEDAKQDLGEGRIPMASGDVAHGGKTGEGSGVDQVREEEEEEEKEQQQQQAKDERQDVDERSEDSEEDGDAPAQEAKQSTDAQQQPSPVDGVVGGRDVGGTFDGTEVELFQQITLPDHPIIQHYDSTQNFWPLHAILRERGWSFATMAPPSRVTLWISKGIIPSRMKEGYQMLNSMGVSGCIGGAKSLQLECRRRLARMHGCEYEQMNVQPPQFNMLIPDDCTRFFQRAEAPGMENKVYLSKPTFTFHGAGIKVHRGPSTLKSLFGNCHVPKNVILMDYVYNTATMMGGYKFDFRTYVLVASLKPRLVFYHDGFVRKSDKKFDLESKDLNVHVTNKATQSKEDHFFNFSVLGQELHREHNLPVDHLDAYVRPRAKQVSRFLFQTTLVQPSPPRHVPGRFHLFGIDWLLDNTGKLHLLEGNGYPLVTHYPDIGLTPKIWQEMMHLILDIQTQPEALMARAKKLLTVKDQFAYGGWKLIYNELEELKDPHKAENVCRLFREEQAVK